MVTKIGTTAVRLEQGFQTAGAAGKSDDAALKVIAKELKAKGIRVSFDGANVITGAALAKMSFGDLRATCSSLGLDPKDVVQALDDCNLEENRGATLDLSKNGELRRTLGLGDGVDGNFADRVKTEREKPKTLPPVVATTPQKITWRTLDPIEVRKMTNPEAADAYDQMMQDRVAVTQLFTGDGLDFGQNCIASSKVQMLRAAGIVRPDVSPMDVIRRAKELGVGDLFSYYSKDAPKNQLTAAMRVLATDPIVGTGVPTNAKVVTTKTEGALAAMEKGGVVLAYVDYDGVPNHHVIAMYKNPYNGKTMAIDPLAPEYDNTPHVFPLSMDPKDRTQTNWIRVSHTRFWAVEG